MWKGLEKRVINPKNELQLASGETMSWSLFRRGDVSVAIFGLAEGEIIGKEIHFCRHLLTVLSGELAVVTNEGETVLRVGELFTVARDDWYELRAIKQTHIMVTTLEEEGK